MVKQSLNWIVVLFVAGALLTACAPAAQPAASGKAAPKVLVTETFLADIVQNVAGDRLKVDALIPLGVDPHGFEPTPRDVKKVADSSVLIVNGAGFESFLEKLVENAGGQRQVVEAAAGLTSREAREGEEAVMSDADLADAMCSAASEEKPQAATAGAGQGQAAPLPAEMGLFEVTLAQQADGSYAGYLAYATDEAGDFQIATGAGEIAVVKHSDGSVLEVEKDFKLNCHSLNQGRIVELEKDGQYILALTGFKTATTPLLIGPAGGHHHHEGDPHFWLDPVNVIKYTENIRDGLSQADPGGAATYARNADAYIAKLKELDAWISEQVKQIPAERRLLVTNHESFGYFADRYRLKIVGTVIPSVSTGASPSAQQLARLTDHIKATGAPAIFLETGANPQLAKQLSQEVGIKAVTELYTHSTTDAKGPAPTYIDMMKYNVKAIVDALKK